MVRALAFILIFAAQPALAFIPTEGEYRFVERTANPTTPNQCNYGDAGSIPDTVLNVTSASTFILTDFITLPDGERVFAAPVQCEFNGNGRAFSCIVPEQVLEFQPFGIDATMRIEEMNWHGAFTASDKLQYTSAPGATTSCTGTQCDLVASFLGPDFSFPCAGSPYGMRYELNETLLKQ